MQGWTEQTETSPAGPSMRLKLQFRNRSRSARIATRIGSRTDRRPDARRHEVKAKTTPEPDQVWNSVARKRKAARRGLMRPDRSGPPHLRSGFQAVQRAVFRMFRSPHA